MPALSENLPEHLAGAGIAIKRSTCGASWDLTMPKALRTASTCGTPEPPWFTLPATQFHVWPCPIPDPRIHEHSGVDVPAAICEYTDDLLALLYAGCAEGGSTLMNPDQLQIVVERVARECITHLCSAPFANLLSRRLGTDALLVVWTPKHATLCAFCDATWWSRASEPESTVPSTTCRTSQQNPAKKNICEGTRQDTLR